MDKLTEQEPEIAPYSSLYRILHIVVKFNIVLYVCEVIFNLISDLRSPDEVITWQSIILATSPNWHSFLNFRLVMLLFGLFIAIVALGLELYSKRRNDES